MKKRYGSKKLLLSTQQETSLDGILIVDQNGKILSYNRLFTHMWGIPPEIIETRDDHRALASILGQLTKPQEFIERVKYLYVHQYDTSREEFCL